MTTKINAINTKHIYPDNNLKIPSHQSASMAFDGRSVNVASPDENQKTLPKSIRRSAEKVHRLLIENEFAALKSVIINKRTNQEGYHFLRDTFEPLGYNVIPVCHEQLHLDCCFNPLGLGHALVHPKSLSDKNTESTMEVLKKQKWVAVTDTEREQLAPNVLSIAPNVIIGRKSPHLSRINSLLSDLGYTVEEVKFDGVPATGGSFRCASMALHRAEVRQS